MRREGGGSGWGPSSLSLRRHDISRPRQCSQSPRKPGIVREQTTESNASSQRRTEISSLGKTRRVYFLNKDKAPGARLATTSLLMSPSNCVAGASVTSNPADVRKCSAYGRLSLTRLVSDHSKEATSGAVDGLQLSTDPLAAYSCGARWLGGRFGRTW